jgi:C4-dicarboxylate-specific signal transduction histidine kinase
VETFDQTGLGLSLYLDNIIVSYLGGKLSVAAARGRGTEVTISLPVATDAAA